MAIQTSAFNINLRTTSATLEHTTSFAVDKILSHITIAVTNTDPDDRANLASTSPVAVGVQETVEIFIDSGEGEAYDCLLGSVNLNGRKYVVWTPPSNAPLYLDSSDELRIRIRPKHDLGTISGVITVNEL